MAGFIIDYVVYNGTRGDHSLFMASNFLTEYLCENIGLDFNIRFDIFIKNPAKPRKTLEEYYTEHERKYTNTPSPYWDKKEKELVISWSNPLMSYDEVTRPGATLSTFTIQSVIVKIQQFLKDVPNDLYPNNNINSDIIIKAIGECATNIPSDIDGLCKLQLDLKPNISTYDDNSDKCSDDVELTIVPDEYHIQFAGKIPDGRQVMITPELSYDVKTGKTCDYVVSYVWDSQGDFINAYIIKIGLRGDYDRSIGEMAYNDAKNMFSDISIGKIIVKTCAIEYGDIQFGFIPYERDGENTVQMMPGNCICFLEPFNGDYDT